MLETIFTALTHAVEGSPAAALSAALAWGVLSILLSPCHLASIPLIVGFIDRQGRMTARRAFAIRTDQPEAGPRYPTRNAYEEEICWILFHLRQAGIYHGGNSTPG